MSCVYLSVTTNFMTTYLTKIEDNKIHHLRLTINGIGVDIVGGIMYNSIEKFWQNCEDEDSAKEFQKKFINIKINEGFQVTEYQESLENNLEVYDKAKWHFEGNFPSDLNNFQAYIHTGMFLGWLIESDLVSAEFLEDFPNDVQSFSKRELTGAQIYNQCCDGVLLLNDLSEEGNKFALNYFELSNGKYMADYEMTLANGLPSTYHVPDTWSNYDKLKSMLDKRFVEFNQNKPK